MKKRLLFTAILSMGLVATVGAVRMSTNGTGQFIIVPYYTVQGGNSTLLSITNTSDDVKAIKFRFRESQNGQRVQSFNLYLAPNDMWTGSVQANSSGAKIITSDPSCTVPVIPENGLGFVSRAYESDGGDKGAGRTREGYVEIVEMGVVIDQDVVAAVTFDQNTGKPKNCSLVEDYWADNGIWRQNASSGMRALAGGLMVQANIINVGDGVEYSETLTVLDDFNDSAQSLHSAPFVLAPSLNSASPMVTSNPDDTWAKPVDAVSGLLMSESLFNEFTVNNAVNATSEWNITFPTKHFYTDMAVGKEPFTSSYTAEGACEDTTIQYWNRDARTQLNSSSLELCYAANIVRLLGASGSSTIFQPKWSGVDFELPATGYANGWAKVNFITLADDASTPPEAGDYVDHIIESGGGSIYAGLPAIGFSASRLGNKNVGVGAAYAATAGHGFVPSEPRAQMDPACIAGDCVDKGSIDTATSGNYDGRIEPLNRNIYHFRSPTQKELGKGNRLFRFTVVDHGAEVSINLGLSKVKGRTQAGAGEVHSCFTGPGTELALIIATDSSHTSCVMELDTDYYFTIESLDEEIRGGYRLEFKTSKY